MKPSESSIAGESTPVMKTLYVDQTDTNTFYFEENEITIRNIPQSTTYEETVTPTLSTLSPVIWPSGMVPIDLLTSIELPLVTMSSSRTSVTHKPSQGSRNSSSSVPVRPTPTRIISGHSYIDSQIGGHSSVSLQPSGSRSGHSEVDSEIGGRSSSVHVEPSQSRSGHSYVDIKPAHSSSQSYDEIRPTHSSSQSHIVHQPSLRVNDTSHTSNYSTLYRKPFPTIDKSSSTVFKPFSSVDQSSVHLKFPVSSVIQSHLSQSQSHTISQPRSRILSSSSFHVDSSHSRSYHPSTGLKSSERHEYSSVPLKPTHTQYEHSSIMLKPSHVVDQTLKHIITTHDGIQVTFKPSHSVDQSYHRSDHSVSTKPSLSMTYSSLHVRPSHGRVETLSKIDLSSRKRVDQPSEEIRLTSSSQRRVDHSSEEILPSRSRDSFYPKPSHTHSILMPSSSESRLPIASRDISSTRKQNLTSMIHRLSSQRHDMISSSSHILLSSRSRERYHTSSSSLTHHVLKTKDVDSVFESKRLYSTPLVFPTNPNEWTTMGVRKSKDYDHTAVPEQPKYSSTSCVSGYGCKSRESVTRTSRFPVEHTKTIDTYVTTERTDSNRWVPTEDYFVTKQIPKWYTVESTPEMTTARSRKTTKKKQRKQGQDYDNKKPSKYTLLTTIPAWKTDFKRQRCRRICLCAPKQHLI